MNESAFFEALGRKQAELEAMHREYNSLLVVLSKVASGEIAPDGVAVDLTARTWKLKVVPVPVPVTVTVEEPANG